MNMNCRISRPLAFPVASCALMIRKAKTATAIGAMSLRAFMRTGGATASTSQATASQR